MSHFVGDREYFPGIGAIGFEGRESKNPLSFKFYDPGKRVLRKTMRDHLRFAVAYWHSFCGTGSDPFGPGTLDFPWDSAASPMDRARQRLDAAFEFVTKLGVPFYCFHDRDMAPAGATVAESERNLQALAALAKERQQATGVKLLWGTANLFSDPRYMNGAATNPDFRVVTHAAAQVKAAIDATIELGGLGYVFWGGREGYSCLLNTDMKRELEHLGRFLAMARDYGRKSGFTGAFFIEPKPMEPSKHQYDFDAKVRRTSTDPEDLFLAHIGGMDAFARGLEIAAALLGDSPLKGFRERRYASFTEGDGLRFSQGQLTLADLAKLAERHEGLPLVSGKQEMLENIINQYI